jgi:hypothetical protein
MALQAHKTEHTGPKKGRGAFYGHKADAKHDSNRRRRQDDKVAAAELDTEPSDDDASIALDAPLL